jgi:hypothetical protein
VLVSDEIRNEIERARIKCAVFWKEECAVFMAKYSNTFEASLCE